MERKSDITSVASLCDWSPMRDNPTKRLSKPSRLTTGRNKYLKPRSLTKGEQEIIVGICSNRGLKDKTMAGSSSITSHKDAWNYHKKSSKTHPLVKLHENESVVFEDDSTDYGIQSHYQECRVCTNQSKYYCADCGKLTAKVLTEEERLSRNCGTTPPSSPTEGGSKNLNSKQIIPPIKSSAGATYVKRTHHKRNNNSSKMAVKTTMNIFLPKLDSTSDTNDPNVVIEEDSLEPPVNSPSIDDLTSKYSLKDNMNMYRYKIDSDDCGRPNPNDKSIFVWNPMDVDWESFSMSGRRPNSLDTKRYLMQNRKRHQFGASSVPVQRGDRNELNTELTEMVKTSSAPVVKQYIMNDQIVRKDASAAMKESERPNTPSSIERQTGHVALAIFKQSKKRQNETNAKALQQSTANELVKTKTLYFQDPFATQSGIGTRSQTLP
ncbi:unnamed protein product [Owenia fusiformis]|nr:unnamed protein product [Owenia fusiformis]